MKEKVLKVLLDHGTLIEPDASDYILSQKDPVKFIKDFLDGRENLPLILSLEDIRTEESVFDFDEIDDDFNQPVLEDEPPRSKEEKVQPQKQFEKPVIQSTPSYSPDDEELHIIMDITSCSTCDGSIDNFTNYFRDRFRVLRRIIKSNVEMSGPIKINKANYSDREMKIIGMVSEVSKTKNGHIGITLEDDTGELFVLIHKDSDLIGETILKDEVIGLIGKVSSNSRGPGNEKSVMFIPTSIHRPKIPVTREQRRSKSDIEVAFLSDIHVGSSHFLPEAWDRFIQWINSPAASKIKYMVVAGDMVDGIGVYPNQEDELTILDIYKQYDELARLMDPIPKHIKIILHPGNHDAVRPAEPQPALPEKFRKSFGENYIFVGNPCYFSIAGVEILSYHGKSIDDLVEGIPEVKYDDPIIPMQEMLKRRHMAVTYGAKTPLAPEVKDYLIINPVPDIFVTGHVHRTAVNRQASITLINASAWQSQTPFQKMHNFHPDAGKIVVTNLKTGRCKILNFLEEK